MDCPSSKLYNRDQRCHRDWTYRELPGSFSFRQEWPLHPCKVDECRNHGSSSSTDASSFDDPCGEDLADQEEVTVAKPGPLSRFDQAVQGYITSDIMNREIPPSRRQIHPSHLGRHTDAAVRVTDDYEAEDMYREFAKKLKKIDKHFAYEQALVVAEEAAAAAPPELAEEAALASARGFTLSLETERTPVSTDGDTIIEIISYLGVTKPSPGTITDQCP